MIRNYVMASLRGSGMKNSMYYEYRIVL